MIDLLSSILAILPFGIFVFLLFFKKTTLLKASIVTLVFYTIFSIFYWQILPSFLFVSYIKGVLVAIDIFIIIFGAILFLEILKKLKILDNISKYLSGISSDYRIQIIIIAWFFEAFLEGTAGFGVPGAVAVPLLMGLGLSPIKSLILALMGNSSPGIFGAAGTPIKVGFSTLNTTSVPLYASIFNFVGIIIPIFMVFIATSGRENRKKEFLEVIPFAIWSGFIFFLPSFLVTKYIGQEFSTILGSIIGLIILIISIKLKIFTPKNNLILTPKLENKEKGIGIFKSFLPYLILIIILILGKIFLGDIRIPINIFILHNFSLFNPGFAFIIAGVSIYLLLGKKVNSIFNNALRVSIKGAIPPFLVISSMLAMVEIMKNSGYNLSFLPSAIDIIARLFESSLLPFLAPFAGAFGSFITGSVTASNIMFGSLFNIASINIGINSVIVLALLLVGGGIGNMIALADILTAEAVVGEKNLERKIIKGVIIPCLLCLLLAGIIGLIIFK